MGVFSGQLNSNEIFSSLFNMIISQQVFADNIKGTFSLVNKARVDGGLYGDTKLYYATDALKSSTWGKDAEATNLLALHRPDAPKCQEVVLDTFRQISLTIDNYLTKRAWGTEGAFASFNAIMLGWIGETKRIYDSTTYNAFIGTAVSSATKGTVSLAVTTAIGSATGEEANRLEAETIAEGIANLLVELKDVSRDYNDYGFLRSYDGEEVKIVWNSAFVNKIKKIDLPTIFHSDGLVDKFEEDILPSRYFGTINTAATKGDGSTVRALEEMDIGSNHYFAGDLIKSTDTAPANKSYKTTSDVIAKVLVKYPPYMSAFEVGTSFYNPKSLTENHYLTWGHNTLEYLKGYPFITVKKA